MTETKKKYSKSNDKNKYCPNLFFFISNCCLFKINRNNRFLFISNIIETKNYHIFNNKNISIHYTCIYRFLILTAVFVFKIFFQFELNEKVYVRNSVSNFLIKLKTKVRVQTNYIFFLITAKISIPHFVYPYIWCILTPFVKATQVYTCTSISYLNSVSAFL